MRNLKRIVIAVIAIIAFSAPASAEFRFGIKAGVNVNSLSFNEKIYKDIIDSENRTGFTVGLTSEFTLPIVGLGFDASLMYTHRPTDLRGKDKLQDNTIPAKWNRDYLEIPLHLKYKLSLPVISRVLVPYFFTGPDFAFLCSKKEIEGAYKNRAVDVAWNLGLGVQLINHLQIGAYHSWGLNKVTRITGLAEPVDLGRTNAWTVTAAWLF